MNHRRILWLVSMCVLIADRLLAQRVGWETFGPPLYQVNAIEAAPGSRTTVYAAGSIYQESQSAVFVSDDGGRSWRTLLQAPSGSFYTELLVDPNDPRTILVGSTSAGSVRVDASIDGGATWAMSQDLSPFCGNPSLAAGPTPGSIFLSCGNLFLRSPDDGGTWTPPVAAFTEPVRLTTAPDGTLYAFGSSGVHSSTDGGGHWTLAAAAPAACPAVTAFVVDPEDARKFFAGTGLLANGRFQCGGAFESTDAGASWTAATLSGVYVSDLAVDPGDPSRVYASASYLAGILPRGGVFESLDGGRTWTNSTLPALGASRVSTSADGRSLYAATPIGAFELGIRKTRWIPPR